MTTTGILDLSGIVATLKAAGIETEVTHQGTEWESARVHLSYESYIAVSPATTETGGQADGIDTCTWADYEAVGESWFPTVAALVAHIVQTLTP